MSGVSIATGVIATDALGGGVGRGLQSPGVFAQGIAAPHTGTTVETAVVTLTIPANALGLSGQLWIRTWWGFSGANGTRQQRIRLNGTVVQDSGSQASTTNSSWGEWFMYNQNSQSSQSRLSFQTPNTASTSAAATAAINTAADITLTITEQLGSALDTANLFGYTVFIINP